MAYPKKFKKKKKGRRRKKVPKSKPGTHTRSEFLAVPHPGKVGSI